MGLVVRPDGTLYLALRERCDLPDRTDSGTLHRGGHRRTGLLGGWWAGPFCQARRAQGLAFARGNLYVADTENHVVRRIELQTGIITTVLGTGQRGDGPGRSASLRARPPHGVFVDAAGSLCGRQRGAPHSRREIATTCNT